MEDKLSDFHKCFRQEMASWNFVPHGSRDDLGRKVCLANWWVAQSTLLRSLTSLKPSILYSLKWKSPSNKEYFTMSFTCILSQKYIALRKIWGLSKLWKVQKLNISDCHKWRQGQCNIKSSISVISQITIRYMKS
jgi:hypothetical protein